MVCHAEHLFEKINVFSVADTEEILDWNWSPLPLTMISKSPFVTWWDALKLWKPPTKGQPRANHLAILILLNQG